MRKYMLLENVEDLRVGSTVDAATAHALSSHGVGLLPVDDTILFQKSALAGASIMHQGGGWQLPTQPGPICPLAMYMLAKASVIHFRAAIAFDGEDLGDFRGDLRLATDSAQPGLRISLATPAVDLAQLVPDRQDGIAYIGASVVLRDAGEGLCGFSLWGYATSPVRVLLVAASQTPLGDTGYDPMAQAAQHNRPEGNPITRGPKAV